MEVKIRQAREDDAPACGRICYEAFKAIANEHNYPPDFPNAEAAIGVLSMILRNREFYGVVAELEDRIASSNFLDERGLIAGLGPITVDPQAQNHGVGRQLMLAPDATVGALRFRRPQARSGRLSSPLAFAIYEVGLRRA